MTRTRAQSTSSSSATSIGSEVFTPWPISGFLAVMTIVPSVPISMNDPSGTVATGDDRRERTLAGTYTLTSRPPAADSPIAITSRRDTTPGLGRPLMSASPGSHSLHEIIRLGPDPDNRVDTIRTKPAPVVRRGD